MSVLQNIIDLVNYTLTILSNWEHPELVVIQTHKVSFCGKWVWNWNRGFFYVQSVPELPVTTTCPINAVIKGKINSKLSKDFPNGIHCKKIVWDFKSSGMPLTEFVKNTNLDQLYFKDVDFIEYLEPLTFEIKKL